MDTLKTIFGRADCVPNRADTEDIMANEYHRAFVWDSLDEKLVEYRKYGIASNPCLNRHLRGVIFASNAVVVYFDNSVELPLCQPGFADHQEPIRVRYNEYNTRMEGCLLYETHLKLEQIMLQCRDGTSHNLKDISLTPS